MAMYYNGKKVRNLYYNGKCITELALGKEMTRLVEGDDFVRAEWLCKYIADTSSESDYSNKAVIDTGVAFDDAILISSKIDNSDLADNAAIGVFDVVNNYSIGVGAVSQTLNFLIVSGSNNHRVTSNVTTFKVSKEGFEINGIPYHNSSVVTLSSNISIAIGALKYTSEYYGNLYRYTTGSYQNKNNGTVKYGALTIYDGNTVVADFIPVRLLRPIPATLDANGIARNAGECGMYNLVNGLFYGNVASSGSFTVEPSLVEGVDYERHKWLVGDGTAYINTGHNTNEDLDWETKVDNIRENTFLFWFRTIQGMGDESMIVRTTPSRFRYANNSSEFEVRLTSQPINVETFGTTIFVNGVGHSITKYYPRPSILFRLFYAELDAASQVTVDTSYTTNSVKCAYFALRNGNVYVMYLTPCRLLRPIPAALDANGIARSAGECGMFDAVSGKFYGNVANNGNFTVSDN